MENEEDNPVNMFYHYGEVFTACSAFVTFAGSFIMCFFMAFKGIFPGSLADRCIVLERILQTALSYTCMWQQAQVSWNEPEQTRKKDKNFQFEKNLNIFLNPSRIYLK